MRPGLCGAAVIALAAAMPGGCVETCPETVVSLDELVRRHNANAAAVPRLWARAKIAVTMVDPDTRLPLRWGSASPLATPNGLLLLGKGPDRLGPHDFVLIGKEPLGDVFRLGSSLEDGKYYLWARAGDRARAWWGWNELAGAPGVTGVPIDPHQLLSVLGVCELPADFTQPPTVALSMSTKPCAYVLTYIDRQPAVAGRPAGGRIVFRREVYFHWSRTRPLRPFLVNIFAADGRRAMTARLRKYEPIDVSQTQDVPGAAPVMPTDIEIEAISGPGAARRSPVRRIRLVLSEMTTAAKGNPRAACRYRPPAGADEVQVDGDVQPGGSAE